MNAFKRYISQLDQYLLLYVEEFDRESGIILADFYDSNSQNYFSNEIMNDGAFNFEGGSMILFTHYSGRRINSGTIYKVRTSSLREMVAVRPAIIDTDSYVVRYIISFEGISLPVFESSFSFPFETGFQTGEFQYSGNFSQSVNFFQTTQSPDQLIVRNVGQGNWNELRRDNKSIVLFDAGTSYTTSRKTVTQLTSPHETEIQNSHPVFILSHWDVDHYHCLRAMDDKTIMSFAIVIVKNNLPSLMARTTFSRLKKLLGNKLITVPDHIPSNGARPQGKVLELLTPLSAQWMLFNGIKHRDRNVSGLGLAIRKSSSSLVLPGDWHYEQITDYVHPHLPQSIPHHLVVPHHGGKAGRYTFDAPFLSAGKAVISVGKNSYKHPLSNYISALFNSGFITSQTNISGDITVQL